MTRGLLSLDCSLQDRLKEKEGTLLSLSLYVSRPRPGDRQLSPGVSLAGILGERCFFWASTRAGLLRLWSFLLSGAG